jgi:hypothetical protein
MGKGIGLAAIAPRPLTTRFSTGLNVLCLICLSQPWSLYADEIASELFQWFVVHASESETAEQFGVPKELSNAFYERSRLYKEAMVWMVLDNQANNDQDYERVLYAFQRLVLSAMPTPEGRGQV